jgi:hypothetical protein
MKLGRPDGGTSVRCMELSRLRPPWPSGDQPLVPYKLSSLGEWLWTGPTLGDNPCRSLAWPHCKRPVPHSVPQLAPRFRSVGPRSPALMGRRPGPLLTAAATSIPPEVLEPVRRQRRVDGRAGDRPMVAMREHLKSEKGQGRRRAKYTTDGAAMTESLRRFPPRW